MLTKKQKKELVRDLAERISNSKSAVLCDYKGLTVAEISQLRRALREVGAEMKVSKKTLIEIALKKVGIEMDIRRLEGQVGIVYGGEDEVSGAKTVYDFSKETDNLKILKGTLEKKELSDKEIIALAKLPSREELLARIVGSIKAPVSGLVNVLEGNLRGLVYALNAIKKSKE